MNTKGNLALAVLAGISIGAVSVMAIHAQEAKTPPAYLITETDVKAIRQGASVSRMFTAEGLLPQ
jgi:hypothetical protein